MPKPDVRILVVDDEKHHAEALKEALELSGYECWSTATSKEALEWLRDQPFDVLITDLVMKEVDGFELVRQATRRSKDMIIFVMTAFGSIESAVDSIKRGATDYFTKPVNLQELRLKLGKELENQRRLRENIELRKAIDDRYGFHQIIGHSPDIQKVLDTLKIIAPTTATVLIQGESGTGKELVAHAIHLNSQRPGPFVPLNCAALSETLLESELFGHEKGAFTGALYQHKGRFEYAHQGTLFLDEIGDMPLPVQAKLLRVIETREIQRLGRNELIKVDVRLIAATNKNLEDLVKEGKFREDLFFRIRVVIITIQPLRQRQQDIPLLLDTFIKEFSQNHHKPISHVTPEARNILFKYPWPGNVRELKNCIENMVIMTSDDVLGTDDIPAYIAQEKVEETPLPILSGVSVEQAELELTKKTLKDTQGNREETARLLGISERTLHRKLKKYGLT